MTKRVVNLASLLTDEPERDAAPRTAHPEGERVPEPAQPVTAPPEQSSPDPDNGTAPQTAQTARRDPQTVPVGPQPPTGAETPPAAPTASLATPSSVTHRDLRRKEVWIRADQRLHLRDLAEHLEAIRQRQAKGAARITEVTLIRLGIDLLLAHEAELRGLDETQLRHSLGLNANASRGL